MVYGKADLVSYPVYFLLVMSGHLEEPRKQAWQRTSRPPTPAFSAPWGKLEQKRITEQTEAMQCLVVEQAHPVLWCLWPPPSKSLMSIALGPLVSLTSQPISPLTNPWPVGYSENLKSQYIIRVKNQAPWGFGKQTKFSGNAAF